jgi:phospholipid-binding lipoprotein MlaA
MTTMTKLSRTAGAPVVRPATWLALLLGMALLTGCATVANPDPRDPLEPYNRSMTRFNEQVDAMVFKPVAVAYQDVLPAPVRTGVSNFFANLGDVWSFFNKCCSCAPRRRPPPSCA